ncbi:MAG: sigma 54-interacting transcriptional regulator, partial [Rickettsiales bacterium]|nr:sigma 54-interacting transcriptional regulator [Rickettsiales bacterium]
MLDRVLVLEDMPSQLRGLGLGGLNPASFLCVPPGEAGSPAGITAEGKVQPGLVIVDFTDYSNGQVQFLLTLRANAPRIPMIALLPFGKEELRPRLMHAGLHDTLLKPLETERLVHCAQLALKLQRMSAQIARLERQASGLVQFSDLVGHSAALRHVVSLAEHVAQSRKHCLIEGEAGTGKTLLARAIHGCMAPFVMVDCEALSLADADAMLFAPGVGKLSQAEGGTLLLREVSVLAVSLQEK